MNRSMYRIFFLPALLGVFAGGAFAQSSSLPPGASAPDTPAAKQLQPDDSPLAAAETKLDSKDYPGALSLLNTYLSAHPTDARALFDKGYAEDASNNIPAAEDAYRKAVSADPQQFEAHLALGLLLAREGKHKDAIAELTAASKLTPTPANPEAQAQGNRALARLQLHADPPAARQALISALRESQETPADTLLAGDIAAADGDAQTASEAYSRVLTTAPANSPEQAQAAAGVAQLLMAAKHYADAEPLLRKALIGNPQDPALNTALAQALSAEGKPDDAIAVLENLHAARPDDMNIAGMLADLDTQNGHADKADPLYVQMLAQKPHDPELLAARGDNLVRQKRFEDAVLVLQEATRLDPQNGNAWSSLAFAADQTHQPQVVLDALAARSKVMSETPATYFLAATAWDTLHQNKRAAELYHQFIAAAGTGFPDEVWQAKHRLIALEH